MAPENYADLFAHARAECDLVHAFLNRTVLPCVLRAVQASDNGQTDWTYWGMLARVQLWLGSLRKLDEDGDFQAIAAGTRALFELAVDFTLLLHGPDDARKIVDWERSASFRLAQNQVEHDAKVGKPSADEYGVAGAFVQQHGPAALEQRGETFGRRGHPPRWTKNSLKEDAYRADSFEDHGFSAFYARRFVSLSWHVHGSGLAGIRHLSAPLFAASNAFALGDAARLAVLSARQCLRILDRYDDVMKVRFDQLERERSRVNPARP